MTKNFVFFNNHFVCLNIIRFLQFICRLFVVFRRTLFMSWAGFRQITSPGGQKHENEQKIKPRLFLFLSVYVNEN